MISQIVGHAKQREALYFRLAQGKLPSALLFAGQRGIGKSLIALELARTMFCERFSQSPIQEHYGGCAECSSCLLFESGNNPDFHKIACDNKESSQIDRVRELLYSLHLRAFGAKVRVVLFTDIEAISSQAANLLLKSLEEPQRDVYFLLTAANKAKMLSTLVSRCQTFYFDDLSEGEIHSALEAKKLDLPEFNDLSPEQLSNLVSLADGSLESISDLTSYLQDWEQLLNSLERIFYGDSTGLVELAQKIAAKKEGILIQIRLLRIAARRKMLENHDAEKKKRWAVCLSNVLRAERLIFERHLGAQYVFQALLAQLLPEKAFGAYEEPRLLDQFVL